MQTWMRESSSMFLKPFKMQWQHSFPTNWILLIILAMAFSSLALPLIQWGWGDRGGSVPWLTPGVRAGRRLSDRYVKGGSLGWFIIFFLFISPPFKEVIFIWKHRWEDGELWSSWRLLIPSSCCTEQIEAGRGFAEATWLCRADRSSLYQHNTLFFWVQDWPFPCSLTFWNKQS